MSCRFYKDNIFYITYKLVNKKNRRKVHERNTLQRDIGNI